MTTITPTHTATPKLQIEGACRECTVKYPVAHSGPVVFLCAFHLRAVNERKALLDTLGLLVRTIGDCMRHGYTNTEVASLQIVWSEAKQVLARAEREEG